MARRKQAPKDLTGIRQRGGRYQVRLFGGLDPVTGQQVMLTGSAEDEDAAIKLRDKFRRPVAEATAARTSVTLGYLLDEWLASPGRGDHADGHCCIKGKGVFASHKGGEAGPSGTLKNRDKPGIRRPAAVPFSQIGGYCLHAVSGHVLIDQSREA